MNLSKAARALLSVTALAWSIPFAQAAEERGEAEETVAVREAPQRAGALTREAGKYGVQEASDERPKHD